MINYVSRRLLSLPNYSSLSSVIQRHNINDLIVLQYLIFSLRNILNKDNIKMAEIGCFMGESSNVFANEVDELYCIDSWSEDVLKIEEEKRVWKDKFNLVESVFDEVVEKNKNITKYKLTSKEASLCFADNFFDFVYIDAEHCYDSVKEDISLWKSKTTKYIGGHDYSDQFPGVKEAVNESLGKPILLLSDSSWVCEIK